MVLSPFLLDLLLLELVVVGSVTGGLVEGVASHAVCDSEALLDPEKRAVAEAFEPRIGGLELFFASAVDEISPGPRDGGFGKT